MEGVPDEDGFIKVTRHGKNKGLRRTEETEKRGHEHIRKRKKKNVGVFYFTKTTNNFFVHLSPAALLSSYLRFLSHNISEGFIYYKV